MEAITITMIYELLSAHYDFQRIHEDLENLRYMVRDHIASKRLAAAAAAGKIIKKSMC